MTEIKDAAYLQGGSHTAQNDRLVLASLYGSDTDGGTLEGMEVSPGTGLSVDVDAGMAIVPNPALWGGPYQVNSDSTVNVVLPAADPVNPRIDLIVAQVYDSAYSGAVDDWEITYVEGSAAPSPSSPAVPDRALVLAEVSVGTSAATLGSPDITDQRVGVASRYLPRSGGPDFPMTGPLHMGGSKVTGMGTPSGLTDGVPLGFITPGGGWEGFVFGGIDSVAGNGGSPQSSLTVNLTGTPKAALFQLTGRTNVATGLAITRGGGFSGSAYYSRGQQWGGPGGNQGFTGGSNIIIAPSGQHRADIFVSGMVSFGENFDEFRVQGQVFSVNSSADDAQWTMGVFAGNVADPTTPLAIKIYAGSNGAEINNFIAESALRVWVAY